MKAELAIPESSFQICDEFAPEDTAEHLHRKHELSPTRNPAALVGGDSASGNDAVEVWMMMKILSPAMQYRQKANPSAEVPWVGRDL